MDYTLTDNANDLTTTNNSLDFILTNNSWDLNLTINVLGFNLTNNTLGFNITNSAFLFNFTGYTNGTDDISVDYYLPNNVRVLLLLLYAITVLLAVGGNGLVIYVVFSLQRMRNITNVYIVNLSCSDIIVTTLCIPFTLLANLIYYYWPFGSFLCPSIMYLQLTSVLQRALTLVAMTLDRHYAIWKPFNRKFTKFEAKCAICLIWVVSALIAVPTAIHTKIMYLPFEPGNKGLCTEVWENHTTRYWYSINIMLLQYFIPLAVMSVTYIHIGIIVWIKRTPGEADNNRDIRLAASKRKTVKMLIVVVSMYALCWLPLNVINIAGDVNPRIYDSKDVHIIWLFCHWLGISNSFSNPVIYFCMNTAFHQGFVLVFRRIMCRDPRVNFRRPHNYASGRTAFSAKSNSSTCSKETQTSRKKSDFTRYD